VSALGKDLVTRMMCYD
jgi:calcium-dependent protein kinase